MKPYSEINYRKSMATNEKFAFPCEFQILLNDIGKIIERDTRFV